MKKNYIVVAHHKPTQLLRMINRLDDNQSHFFVHVDKKIQIEQFELLKGNKNVTLLEERFDCIWGDISQVDATLSAMRYIQRKGCEGYTILLSGQDYPIVSNQVINDFFQQNNGFDFVDLRPVEDVWKRFYARLDWYRINISNNRGDFGLIAPFDRNHLFSTYNLRAAYWALRFLIRNKRGVYSNSDIIRFLFKERMRYPLPYYGGSNWFAITKATQDLILEFVDNNPLYKKYHEHTHCADEIFFQTIIADLYKKGLTDKPFESITYVNWERPNVALPVTFNESDFEELMLAREKKLFARKFDIDRFPEILNLIDQEMLCD